MITYTNPQRAYGEPPAIEGRKRVGQRERIASSIIGTGLLLAGIRCLARGRPIRGAALTTIGGMLTSRGATGRCGAYKRLGVEADDATARSTPMSRHIHVRHSIAINAPASEIYARWRDIGSLPLILSHVKRVDVIDSLRSRWTAEGPMGSNVTWEAIIEEDRPGRLISWRSTDNSTVDTEGRVEFLDAPADRGSVMHVDLVYRPPGGVVGAAAAKLFRTDPEQEIREDLRRFKQSVEARELTSSESPSARDVSRFRGPTSELDGPHRTGIPESERRAPERRDIDTVEEASRQSFPASDAPAW